MRNKWLAATLAASMLAGTVCSFNVSAAVKEQIVVGRPEDSNNLDPVTQDGNVNIWVLNLVMEGLMELDTDGKTPVCDLAESYEVSEDNMTYTFKLLPDLTFSTGEPVLGEDWVWTYERAMTTEDSSWTELCANIDSVEAPDDTTFIIHMKNATPYAEKTFGLFTLCVGDKSYFEEVGLEQYSLCPVGTGAYKFTDWVQGEYLVVEKNENYRFADRVQTQSIRFNVVPDDNTRIMQLQNGDVDIITYVPYSRLAELDADANINVLTPDSTEVRTLMLNCQNGPTADMKVRQALSKAINPDAILAAVLYGYGSIGDSFTSPALEYYYAPETQGYDVEGAKALMEEAGYADGCDLTCTIPSGNTTYEMIATLLQQMWAQIGVNLTIETLEVGTLNSKRNALELDMFFGGWTSDIPDLSQQSSYFCNPDLADCVHTGWINEEAKALEQQAEIEMDPEKRAEEYKELQQLYADEVPGIIMYYAPHTVATSAKVSGFVQQPTGIYCFEELACEE